MVFLLQFVNAVYHTDGFVDSEEPLHPWDKSHLVMMYNPFECTVGCGLLACCCGFLPVVFCVVPLSGFGSRLMVASWNEFGSVPSSTIFWNSFRRIGVSSSLRVFGGICL